MLQIPIKDQNLMIFQVLIKHRFKLVCYLILIFLICNLAIISDNVLCREIGLANFSGFPKCPSVEEIKHAPFVEKGNNTCMISGIPYVSCHDNSLIIKQKICSGWLYITETFLFTHCRETKNFYLCGRARSHILAGEMPVPEGWPATG